jgi:hypothetical protein
MHHAINPVVLEEAPKGIPVAEVADQHFRTRRRGTMPILQIIQADDFVPALDEGLDRVAAHVTKTTGYQDQVKDLRSGIVES